VTLTFALPALAAILTAVGAGLISRRLPPALATRLLTGAVVVAATAALSATAAIAAVYVSQLPGLAWVLGWCHAVAGHHHDHVASELGLLAIVLLGAMSVGGARAGLRWRRSMRSGAATDGVEIVSADAPVAFAVPGRPGHVVVSVGMIRRLDADERRVLFAHEEAHLVHRHHRYLMLAHIAASAVPLLRPLSQHISFCTERWADEVAASRVGSRDLVARAIARAALAGQPSHSTLAFIGTGVVARVDALLRGRTSVLRAAPLTGVLVTLLLATATGLGVQIHHLATLVNHVCD
jgi:Peptidase family M48